MTTKHRAEVLADKIENAKTDYACLSYAADAPDMLRTIPALETEIEKLKAENKALIDVITRAEVKPVCNAKSTSIRGN